jgi:hypothetical protein
VPARCLKQVCCRERDRRVHRLDREQSKIPLVRTLATICGGAFINSRTTIDDTRTAERDFISAVQSRCCRAIVVPFAAASVASPNDRTCVSIIARSFTRPCLRRGRSS